MRLILILLLPLLAACAAPPPAAPPATLTGPPPAHPAALDRAILALAPGVDADEARRAAALARAHPLALARAWGADASPLVHNARVNLGLRPKGLCYHWADEMYVRLSAERFETLDLHLAVANADNPFRLEHSTAVVSARGAPMRAGIVLDPWRRGEGRLHWAPVADDAAYDWVPRADVLAAKRARGVAVGRREVALPR
jgi:hypothetical protein